MEVAAVAVAAHWCCARWDVEGRDPVTESSCWNCGGAVIVTTRPSLEWTESALYAE
jgi:hypothetical protein